MIWDLHIGSDGKLYGNVWTDSYVYADDDTDKLNPLATRLNKNLFVWDASKLVEMAEAAYKNNKGITSKPFDLKSENGKDVQISPPQKIDGTSSDGVKTDDLFGWIVGIGKYASTSQVVNLKASGYSAYFDLVTNPYYGAGQDDNVYTDAMGISRTEIAKKIQNGEYDGYDASWYYLKTGLYNTWDFATLGFVGRNAERVKQNDAGVLSDSEYGWSAGIDAVGTVGAMIIGNRVGTAVEARYGAGFYAMASEAVTFAVVDTYAQSLIYKVTDGKTGTGNSSEAFVNSVSMDMIVGAGLHLASRLNFGAKVLWKMPTEGNTFEYKIVMPTSRADIEAKYLFTKADSTGRSLILGDGGKYTSAISGKEIELPKPNSLVSTDVSDWLVKQATEMKAIMDKIKKDNPTMSSEDLSIIAVNIRNAFVNTARQSIADPRVFAKLEGNRPLWDYKVKEAELAAEGYSGRALHDKLMKDAFDVDNLKLEVKHVQCFPAGTLVHTDKGLVPIQNIKVGDMVLSRPEWGGKNAPTEYKRVTRAFCSGEDLIYRLLYVDHDVEYSDGERLKVKTLFVSENHPIWVESRKEWVPVCNIDDYESTLSSFDSKKEFSVVSVYPVLKVEKHLIQINKNALFDLSKVGFCSRNEMWPDLDMVIVDSATGLKVGSYDIDSSYDARHDYNTLSIEETEYLWNFRGGVATLSTQVFNLEVEEYHTYFVGEDGIWVHNDNCFYEYDPNLAFNNAPLPNSVKARGGFGNNTLPDFVHWAPTLENIKEIFTDPKKGGVFVTDAPIRNTKGGEFERASNYALTDTKFNNHLEIGLVFDNPHKQIKPKSKDWRMYDGAKTADNGKIIVIDRKNYNPSDWKFEPLGLNLRNELLGNMHTDVLAISTNLNKVDSVVYSFSNQSGLDFMKENLLNIKTLFIRIFLNLAQFHQ